MELTKQGKKIINLLRAQEKVQTDWQKINLIKIDVQGLETSVLEGMVGTISNNMVEKIIFEYAPYYIKMAKDKFNLNRVVRNATRNTLNRVSRKAFTAASRKVRETYNIKARDLKKYSKIRRASNQVMRAEINIFGARLPVYAFGAKKNPKGVTVKIKKATKKIDSLL